MKIKDDFHHLIDSIEDEKLLQSYYQLIQKINDGNGHLWNTLDEDGKKELLIAYEESFHTDNMLSHEQVKVNLPVTFSKNPNVMALAGIWKDRDITLEQIRKEGRV